MRRFNYSKGYRKGRKVSSASKDKLGRLIVGGAIGVGDNEGLERAEAFLKKQVLMFL